MGEDMGPVRAPARGGLTWRNWEQYAQARSRGSQQLLAGWALRNQPVSRIAAGSAQPSLPN
ncbi:hypothetical protein GCM10007888_54590 [Methylobacterium oxalidis]|uniref:Uncharacterized protein n=1 Tax=Methylobacterium oxalidis TaxID=944322 RepID=A0ABQ6DSV1_9HYPH|nr:hypothetical protein GCM10007888_54590 [Methylobacterium oxalidis]